MSSAYVSRINQLDALELDQEIHRIFITKTQQISLLFTPGVTDKWTPEINAIIRSLIWIFSLATGKSTFGQKLLNLIYINLSKKKSILILILSVVPKYLEEKYTDINRISVTQSDKKFEKYLIKIIDIIYLMNFINLLIFLNRGTQPTILERLLGISSRNIASVRPRTIGYSYMTRELLWHGLMELFTTGLPMINFQYLKRFFISKFGNKNWNNGKNEVIPIMTSRTLCPYCNETPVLPHYAGCNHIYCYYCMSGNFKVDESFDCLSCGRELYSRDMRIYSVSLG